MLSLTPVIVTVCVVFQLAAVKVRLDGETVPSAVLLEVSPMVTLAVGWLVRTTVKVAVPPASVVVNPLVGVTVMPAASLSVLVTDTSDGFITLYLLSVLVACAVTIV